MQIVIENTRLEDYNFFGLHIDEETQEVRICLKVFDILADETVAISPYCVSPEQIKAWRKMLTKDFNKIDKLADELKPTFKKWRQKREHPSIRAGRPYRII